MMNSPKHTILCLSLMLLVGLFLPIVGHSSQLDKADYDKIKYAVYESSPLIVHGTEYKAGENSRIFLQLKDPNSQPILNASCYLDLFLPNMTQAVIDGPMLYLKDSDGIYFYDYVPSFVGVYALSAECKYSQNVKWYYTLTGWNPFAETCGGEKIVANASVGTGYGDTISLNNLMDWMYYRVDTATKFLNVTFTYNSSTQNCKINRTNAQTLDFYYMGETDYATSTLSFYIWNWNSSKWDLMGNVAPFGLAFSTGTSGVSDYFAKSLNLNNYTNNDGTAKVMVYGSGGTNFRLWMDWMAFRTSGNATAMTDLKGSGELHVSTQQQQIDVCSVILDRQIYHPAESMRFYLYSSVNQSSYRIVYQNGTSVYQSPPQNNTGVFGFAFAIPNALGSYYIEQRCGGGFAYASFLNVASSFWDIDWKPLIILIFALLMILFIVAIRRGQ